MPRPEFPHCVMPVEVIRRINEEQAYYDKDPERAEREQRRRKEMREDEQRQEQEQEERSRNEH